MGILVFGVLALLIALIVGGFILAMVQRRRVAGSMPGGPVRPARPFLAPALWLVLAIVAAIAAVIVGSIPWAVTNGTGVTCPSAIDWLGADPLSRSIVDAASGNECGPHAARMGGVMFTLFALTAIGVIVGIIFIGARVNARTSPPAAGTITVATAAPVSTAPTAPASPPVTPAGWFPVPDRPGVLRWWDGDAWTDNYHGET